MKLCVDCASALKDQGQWVCGHDTAFRRVSDLPVTGERSARTLHLCAVQRADTDACGPEGSLWTAKPAMRDPAKGPLAAALAGVRHLLRC